MSRRPGCLARQYGDQLICAPCGLTWDTNDPEPPECRKNIKRAAARVAKFEESTAPLKSLPDKLPSDVAAEMVKGYQANGGHMAGTQAAYRIFLDRMEP